MALSPALGNSPSSRDGEISSERARDGEKGAERDDPLPRQNSIGTSGLRICTSLFLLRNYRPWDPGLATALHTRGDRCCTRVIW